MNYSRICRKVIRIRELRSRRCLSISDYRKNRDSKISKKIDLDSTDLRLENGASDFKDSKKPYLDDDSRPSLSYLIIFIL